MIDSRLLRHLGSRARSLAVLPVLGVRVLASPSHPTHGQRLLAAAAHATERADLAALRREIERVARASGGRLGVGIELLETGERLVMNGGDRYPMQSVYKLPIAMAALDAVDRGHLRLDDPVEVRPADFVGPRQHSPVRDAHPSGARLPFRELLRLAASESDGTASDVVLRVIGGAGRVAEYLRRVGVRGVVVADTEREIGADERVQYRNWATPSGALALLRAAHAGGALSDSSRALLRRFLVETPTGAGRLRGGLPAGTVVAHKTGSSRTVGGRTAATNDVGILTLPDGRHLAVAVFLSDSRLDDAGRDRTIARVARVAWDAWTATGRSAAGGG